MAGPNWFTGSFGTTSPFQQTSSTFFRNTPFGGGGFGPGNTPFSNPSFGFSGSTFPFQNMIQEIVRQTVPQSLASAGFPTTGFQTAFGTPGPFSSPNPWSFPTPTGPTAFGFPFQTSEWQNPGLFSEIIRQATNQAIQTTWPSNATGFNPFASSPTTPYFGLGTTGQQQNLPISILQICQQACQSIGQTLCQAVITGVTESLNTQSFSQNTPFSGFGFNPQQQNTPFSGFGFNPQQQNIWNLCAQICQQACLQVCTTVCQTVAACVNECLNTQNASPNAPFGTPNAFGTNWQQQNPGNFTAQICQQACQSISQTLCQAVITGVTESLNLQNRSQTTSFSGFGFNPQQQNTPFSGFGFNPQQQNIWNLCAQICQQACQQACTTLCQATAACVNECLNTQNRASGTPYFNTTNSPFRTPGTPFNINSTTSQYGFTPGIPTGAGAF